MNMDWAEELKMSIRKTARRGRRSKSRDLDAPPTAATTTSSSSTTNAAAGNKELSIDITLDLQQNTTSPSGQSTAGTFSATDEPGGFPGIHSPPMRRISGGWADTGGMKSSKFKRGSMDDDRFQPASPKSPIHSPQIEDDNIPVIPDLDDVKDEILMNEIVEPPSVSVNRFATLKELNSEDLLTQNAFSAIDDVDLSILTRCLQAQSSLDEADEVWEWDKVFTEVTAEIHSDSKADASEENRPAQKKGLASPRETPATPLMYT